MRFSRRHARLGRLRRQARFELTARRQRTNVHQPFDSGALGAGQFQRVTRLGHVQLECWPVLAVSAVGNDFGERVPTGDVRPHRARGQLAGQSARHRGCDVDLATSARLDFSREHEALAHLVLLGRRGGKVERPLLFLEKRNRPVFGFLRHGERRGVCHRQHRDVAQIVAVHQTWRVQHQFEPEATSLARRDVDTEDAGASRHVHRELLVSSARQTDRGAALPKRLESREIGEVNREPARLPFDERWVLHEQLALRGPPRLDDRRWLPDLGRVGCRGYGAPARHCA